MEEMMSGKRDEAREQAAREAFHQSLLDQGYSEAEIARKGAWNTMMFGKRNGRSEAEIEAARKEWARRTK